MKKKKTPWSKRPVLRILVIWIIQTVALLIMAYLMDSVQVESIWVALAVTAVAGLLNALNMAFVDLCSGPLCHSHIGHRRFAAQRSDCLVGRRVGARIHGGQFLVRLLADAGRSDNHLRSQQFVYHR